MGDLVRYRLCFRLFGRKPDPLHVEMTLHQFHKKVATIAPDIELNSSSYGLDPREDAERHAVCFELIHGFR